MNFLILLELFALVVIAYLLGSISNAIIIGKRFYNIDVREHGSKNAGATNTFRVLGKKPGAIVFLLDFFKGFLAIYLFSFTNIELEYNIYIKSTLAIIVTLGHVFPLYHGFKGGKGVATIAGAIMGIAPLEISICLGIFAIVLTISRTVSISSMLSAICFPVVVVFFDGSVELIVFSSAIALGLVLLHRSNIKRILKGEEKKLF